MAKKAAAANSDRTDPKKNKSLAVRNMIAKMPTAKHAEVAKAVKEEYGHDVPNSLFYALKAKGNMKATRNAKKKAAVDSGTTAPKEARSPINSAAMWVEAIKLGRQLLKATGSVENATALLKAIEA